MSTKCPLCSVAVALSELESHLRFELRLPLYACSLCPVTFCSRKEADRHFNGSLAEHPGLQVQLISHPADPVKEDRLVELLRLARGGREAVQERLCVCGQCRLLCREDFQPPYLPVTRTQDLQNNDEHNSVTRFGTYNSQEQRLEEDSPDPEFHFQSGMSPIKPAQLIRVAPESPLQTPDDEQEVNEQSDRYDQEQYNQQNWQPIEEEAVRAKRQYTVEQNSPINRSPNDTATDGDWREFDEEPHDQDTLTPDKKDQTSIKKAMHFQKATVAEAKQEIKYPKTNEAISAGNKLRCRSCSKTVRKNDTKEHASKIHLKKPLYKCKSCDFESSRYNAYYVNRHVKSAHGKTPGPGTVDATGLQKHTPALEAMIGKLFGV